MANIGLATAFFAVAFLIYDIGRAQWPLPVKKPIYRLQATLFYQGIEGL
jgi:hypothetical protein